MTKRPLVLLYTIAAVALRLSAQPVLTPDEALRIALKNNYDILIAGNAAEIAKVNNTPGNAGMFPLATLTGSDNYSINEPPLGDGTPDSYRRQLNSLNVGAHLDWTIFDGGKMFVTRKKLSEIEAMGTIEYKNEVMQTAYAVIVAYYNVVRQKQQLASLNEVIMLNRERVTIAQTSFASGLSPKTTLLQSQVDLNVYREKALEQGNVITAAKRELNLLLCREIETGFEVEGSIPLDTLPEKKRMFEKLDSSNTSIRSFQKQVEVAALNLRENRALFLPKVAISAGYSLSSNVATSGSPGASVTYGPQAGATVSIPLYQGGDAIRRTKTSRLALESAQNDLQNIRQQVRVQLRNVLDDFESQQQLLQIERENILFAKENLDISMQRLRLGQSTSLELRQAEESYEDSRTRLLTIEYNLKVAETKLKLLMAEL